MRKFTILAAAFALLAADLVSQPGRGRGRGRRTQNDAAVELQNFTFQRVDYDSPSANGGSSEFGVYLPKSYSDEANAEKKYPWVVWLHGMNGSYRRFHHEGGAKVLDTMRGEGEIPEMIVIAATAARRTAYVNGERGGDYEDLITKDLLSYVRENYRVAEERNHRALMGVSIGGFGALKIAFRNPELFGTVAAHSSALFPSSFDDMEGRTAFRIERTARGLGLGELLDDEQRWRSENPTSIIEDLKDPKSLKGLRIYFDAGTDDRYGFAQPNELLHQTMDKQKVTHTFNMIEGGGHAWGSGSLQKAMVNSLKFVGEAFAPKQGKAVEAKADKGDDAAVKKGESKS